MVTSTPRNERGFTLIEFMVALSIAAVMMLYAIPSFRDFTQQRQMAANVNLMVGAINYARSEAVRLGGTVSVQAVDASDSDNEWGPGFCVTVVPGDCTVPLKIFQLEGTTATLNAINALNDEPTLSFNSRGMITGGLLGAIQLCGEDDDDDPGRVLNVNAVGRASVADLDCY